mmetsp:Transcript_46665/g.68988  ORF Transcript_46665/g.68988 Transcript_46665/m.68988 type:complete len:320 (+) Transcript_46665:276-1235(+)
MDVVFRSLASVSSLSSPIAFYRVEAEAMPDLSLKYGVTIVPTFILLDETQQVVDRVEGVDPARLTQAVRTLISLSTDTTTNSPAVSSTTAAEAAQPPSLSPEEEATQKQSQLDDRLAKLVNAQEVMLFMKGTPSAPRCGFSRQATAILEEAGICFGSFDILDPKEQDVRSGLKLKYDWPTFPQLYVRGELIGGLDILKEMNDDTTETLCSQLGVAKQESMDEKLKKLLNRSRIMLFMKGFPSAPRCGFSRKIVDILEEEGVAFDAFNILEDEDVRQALKVYSDWPTYPQLYVDGELVGGLDLVVEMKESGDLTDLLKGQ